MDDELSELARRSPNFGRLYRLSPLLALYGAQAETMVYDHPNLSLVQSGKFGETLAEILVMKLAIKVDGSTHAARVRALARAGAVLPEIERDFDHIRLERNRVSHGHEFDVSRALECLQISHKLGLWYHDGVTGKRTAEAFVPPPASGAEDTDTRIAELLESYSEVLTDAQTRLSEYADRSEAERRARLEAERLMASSLEVQAEMRQQLDELRKRIEQLDRQHSEAYASAQAQPPRTDEGARDAIVYRLRRERPRNEIESRREIDRLLEAAGWKIQDFGDHDRSAGLGVAVREFPIRSGRADYVLYVDKQIVGVLEAKKEGASLSAAVEQNDRYAKGLEAEGTLAAWRRDEPLAFRYASTGAETWFVNRLDPEPRSREVFSFHRPETVKRWMDEAERFPEAPTYRSRLRTLPELEEYGFRPAQVDAITGLEQSLALDKPKALIQMATGAGKTYMGAAETYRLLKYARAGRVLFLVDRNNLGLQAESEFTNYVAPDDGRKLGELYNIDRLGPAGLRPESSVVICTIQRMYSLLRGERIDDDTADALDDEPVPDRPVEVGYNPAVPIESFDLIFIDECHRSIYGIWRGVLDYFDAHLVGLTATPSKQTVGFFGKNLVSEYTYPESVADGVNVDFDILKLGTNIRDDGSVTIERGEVVEVRDRETRHRRYEQLDDDFTYTVRQIGRKVETVDEIREVLSYYRDHWTEWFPGRSEIPKTLIFAASDQHADSVVAQTREVFGRGDDFAKKITYTTRQAGEDPEQLIRDFRTSPRLRVAVTVDMIATGTDVRALECVIFLRDVSSPILFEQMKGRGARTIDPTELQAVTPEADETVRKSSFLLIDAVGVTDHPKNDSKPLVPQGKRQFSLAKLLDKAGTGAIDVEETEILAGRLARLNQQIDDGQREQLERASGGTSLTRIAHDLMGAADPNNQEAVKDRVREVGGGEREAEKAARELIEQAIAPLSENPRLRREILEVRRERDYVVDGITTAEVTSVEKVTAEDRAQEVLESWHDFLEANRDEITVIDMVMNHPGRITPGEVHAELSALAASIRRPTKMWTPEYLWMCYERVGKAAEHPNGEAGIPDLVSLIRYELGEDDELRPYEEVVRERFAGWLLRQEQAGAEFTDEQMWWLERVRDIIASDVGMEPRALKQEPFTERGGAVGFKRAFPDRNPRELLNDLNRELA